MVRFHIGKENPQPRSIRKAAELVRAGGLAIYPTDTTYGLGATYIPSARWTEFIP